MVAQDGGRFGGRLWSIRGEGWDRGKPLSACPTPTRRRRWVPPDLPGGRRGRTFLSPRRVPRETLGSSVVIFMVLLEGVDWYRCFGALELGGRPSVGAVAVKLLRFRRSAVVGILFFCCFSFVSFGCDCAASAPAPILVCIGWLLWNTKRGETLFRQILKW